METLDWENSIGLSGDIAAEIASLKEQEGHLLQVHGSWQLIQTLLQNDLIDELRLWIFPVVVGRGKKLFGEDVIATEFSLQKTKANSNGVVMCIYRRNNVITGKVN